VIDSGYGYFAQTIVAEANDAYIEAMDYPELDKWASLNGFTKDELALIQPTYCPAPENAQLITATLVIFVVSWLVILAGMPLAVTNFVKGIHRNIDGKWTIKSGVKLGMLLIVLAAIMALRIATDNDVLSDLRVIETSYGFDGAPCEDIVYRVTNRFVIASIVIGLTYIGSARWRVYRGGKSEKSATLM
jgi:hypothetical protein